MAKAICWVHYGAQEVKDLTSDALVVLIKKNIQSLQSLLLCCWGFCTIDAVDVISDVLLTVVCILDYCK